MKQNPMFWREGIEMSIERFCYDVY